MAIGEGELGAWLRLLRAPGFGPRQLLPWLDSPQSATALVSGVRGPPGLASALAAVEQHAVEADLEWCQQPGQHLLPLHSPHYPQRLRDTADPPLALFVRGDPEVLSLPQIAIVGSRNPTHAGSDTATRFGDYLSSRGLAVTSGLALGIDGAAHRGALRAGGLTLAVLGAGLANIYPASHRELAEAITAEGALISEFPPDTPPRPGNFPRRNRIISGLSLGVLVVEAALRSGSLITARLALEQGREVFAVPGSIHSPLAKGCHQLIRQGAKLVETGADVLEELASQIRLPLAPEPDDLVPASRLETMDPDYQRLLEALGYDPVNSDTLIRRTGLQPSEIASMLLVLELEGHVSSEPGGLFLRREPPAG
jgi:DNA processing protein